VVRAAASGNARHIPVLLPQVLEALEPSAGKRFIDATYGAGGYSRAILDAAECRVLAFDRDPSAIAGGADDVARYQGRLLLHHGRFGDMEAAATALGFAPCDGVVLDIGVSSMQLDEPERGFSFMSDGPLDMRMSSEGVTAAAVVNDTEQDALANIIF
jgi:16S rRNA (cytosine1402-N4)-methyltransferase